MSTKLKDNETEISVWPITFNDVDVSNSKFNATFRLVLRFNCPSLQTIKPFKKVDNRTYYDPSDLLDYLPGQALEIQNSIEHEIRQTRFYGYDRNDTCLVFHIEGRPKHELTAEIVYKGVFKYLFDLRAFPFDEQELLIIMKIWRKTEADYTRTYIACLERQVDIKKDMLQLPDYSIRTHEMKVDGNPCDAVYSVKIKRRPWFYTISTTISLFVILFLALLTFSLGIDERGDRLTITSSLLLATIAVKFVVASDIPRVPYFTMLDREIILVFAYLLAIATIHSFVETPIDNYHGTVLAGVLMACVSLLMIIRPLRHWIKRRRQRKVDLLHENQLRP